MSKPGFRDTTQGLSLKNVDETHYAGVNPFEALKNIKKRCQERKEGRQSALRTALVLQGGGMRGVLSGGVCLALQEMGYTEGFDEVFGVSSGALNGAYFLSGQGPYGGTIYYQDINNREFINLLRFRKIVDISFLMNIIANVKPLNVERLRSSSTVFSILLTEVSSGKTVIFTNKSGNTDIINILKASAAMPFAYDRPVTIDGVDYFDGGVSCPIPIAEAITAGCTDILVVLSRPRDFLPSPNKGIITRYWIEPRIKRHGRNFYQVFKKSHEIHREHLRIIKGETTYAGKQANILVLFPEKPVRVTRMTKKARILKGAMIETTLKTFQLFGVYDYHPVEVLKFLNS